MSKLLGKFTGPSWFISGRRLPRSKSKGSFTVRRTSASHSPGTTTGLFFCKKTRSACGVHGAQTASRPIGRCRVRTGYMWSPHMQASPMPASSPRVNPMAAKGLLRRRKTTRTAPTTTSPTTRFVKTLTGVPMRRPIKAQSTMYIVLARILARGLTFGCGTCIFIRLPFCWGCRLGFNPPSAEPYVYSSATLCVRAVAKLSWPRDHG